MFYGTQEHKELFCRVFIDTHKSFRPEDLSWPDLSEETVKKLLSFPIWDHAVHTESQVFVKFQAYAETETDPLLREALELQAREEERHANLLRYFLKRYDIPHEEKPDNPLPDDLEWGFLRTGAGECIDSFFAFGFLEISKNSRDYPRELIAVMEPIVQEEARHILFIQNWILYQRYSRALLLQPVHYLWTLWAYFCAGMDRLKNLKNLGGSSFTIQARKHEKSSLSPRDFIVLCLRENKRRLAPYDARLARPKLIPEMMKLARLVL
ncbi:MAG: ferritin-like domain-containing protein [Nitrospinales bacterium]